MENKCKVAFIGAGYMATEHAKAFGDIERVQLSGIFSRTRSRSETLATEYSMNAVCGSVGELYEETKADLVVIAVSELSVREVCLEAFKHPWACLIEKPAGYDVADAEKVLSAAKGSDRKAFVALNRRHYSSTLAVMDDLADHNGQRLVQVLDQENPRVALDGGQPKKVVDNWMYANSIHLVDYFSLFCRGELLSIDNLTKWRPDEPCFILSKLTYSSGDIGVYEAIWEGPGPWAVTVTTPSRRWELRPLEQAAFQNYMSRKVEPFPVHPWDNHFKPGLRQQAEEAIRALGDAAHRLPTLEEGLQAMNIARRIYGG